MDYKQRYMDWLENSFFDEATRAELRGLSEREIEDRFYKGLSFGTGGLRGLMGAGTNRINRYTVRIASAAVAAWVKKTAVGGSAPCVAVAYDTRLLSAEYALETALTLCAAGVRAILFSQPVPTPVLSFSVLQLHCDAGIVITASHNPKEYNGYKVYNRSGGQLVPHEAQQIIEEITAGPELEKIPILTVEDAEHLGLLCPADDTVMDEFLLAVRAQALPVAAAAKEALSVVYTPLHGTGLVPVRSILVRDGFSVLSVVAEQATPDGAFPTVRSPNPEERDTLSFAISTAQALNADLVLGTDPDCDRVGVAVRGPEGYVLLTGNQIGALLVDGVLRHRQAAGRLNNRCTLIKTIVTSELGAEIAKDYGLQVLNTLTGFKYIGEKIREFEIDPQKSREFVIGYEESYGYLAGTHSRDKDAVVAAMLICELAAEYKAKGRSLLDELERLGKRYGYYADALDSFELEGVEGLRQIEALMDFLRKAGRNAVEGTEKLEDYLNDDFGLPRENVLRFRLADGSWIAVRPSGTEPKIKVYYSIRGESARLAAQRLERYQSVMRGYLQP